MKKIPVRTKIIAASIGLLMAIVLVVGGTFAWLVLSKQPQVQKMTINVANSTILEIAQAYPENYEYGPPEVGENDNSKTRVVNGQTVADQGVWGKIVDMTDNRIILQEPATFDKTTNKLSTVKFDRTGRTNGFQELIKQDINEEGLIYFTKEAASGNYRGDDGYIHTVDPDMATSSVASPSSGSYTPPTNVKCAGGIAVWMRSNKPTSEEVFLKGLTIARTDDNGNTTTEITSDDILGVVITTYHLKKTAEDKAEERRTNVRHKGVLEPFNNYFAQKTDNGYVCTLFAGSSTQQMQPGELYLVEIICYIEGDRENDQGNTAAVSSNTGITRRVSFDSIDCQDVLYAAKVTEESQITRNNGWYADVPTLKIELFGSSEEVDNKDIIIEYKMTPVDNSDDIVEEGSFMAFDDKGQKNSVTFQVPDGQYALRVSTAQVNKDGEVDESKLIYYTVSISDTSMVNTVPDDIIVRVDTTKPTVDTRIDTCGCTYKEADGTTYHNHEVKVYATAWEENLSSLRIGGRLVTPATTSESDYKYHADRLYAKEGDYTVQVVATDRSGKSNEEGVVDSITGRRFDQVHFIIDKTKPVLESVKWGFFNDSGAAEILNKITGSAFFNKKVRLQITGTDDHLMSMTLSDSTGEINGNPVKDGDGKRITCTVDIPLGYQDEIKIKIQDKAGNYIEDTTGPINITSSAPETIESHTGEKSRPDEDPVVWYDITYHLEPSGSNADRVTGFEFSRNGTDWYSTDQHMGDVYYKVKKNRRDCDTVTIYCDDYKSVTGTIHFRAVTDIIDDMSGVSPQYVKGEPLSMSYKLEAITPDVPQVTAYGSVPQGNEVLPTQGPVEFRLAGGDGYKLKVDHYEYSLDCVNWYSEDKTFGDLTVKVGGDKKEAILVEGSDDTDTKSQMYFRTVSTKLEDPERMLCGAASPMFMHDIDRKDPVITDARWYYVNDSSISGILSSLTGKLFFNKKIVAQVTGMDANIDRITCDSHSGYNERTAADTMEGRVYLNPDFDGELYFRVYDKADNETGYQTARLYVSTLTVVEVPYTDDGYRGCEYSLSLPLNLDPVTETYEYSVDGGANWYSTSHYDENYTYWVGEPDPYWPCHRWLGIQARSKASPSETELPATLDFRVIVTQEDGEQTIYNADHSYVYKRPWP